MGTCLRRPLVATLFVCLLLAPLALSAAPGDLRIEEVGGVAEPKLPIPGVKVPDAPGLPNYAPDGMAFFLETEPNDTAATANALAGSGAVVYGTISPAVEVDWFSFTANAGDRVSIATMTQFSNGGSTDTILTLYASDGTTVLETDDDSGSFSGLSSVISGAVIPAAGTYYILVDGFSGTSTITPYHLHVKVASGSATPEVEPNNDTTTATPLPASGWASGTITATTDPDLFSFSLNAGDSVFLALDMDPDRAAANTNWNGRLGFGLFNNFFLVANDGSTTKPHAEALFFTVRDAGTYYAYVDSAVATGLGANARYHLHVRVIPARVQTDCTVIASTDVPVAIGPAAGTVTSTISVPGTVTNAINDVKVRIDLEHLAMLDLDVTLTAPSATAVPLFTDIGSTTQPLMNLVLDENAALPIGAFTVVSGMVHQPEQPGRLAAFNGQAAGGTWTLSLADDTTNTSGGTLNAWSLEICGTPPGADLAITKTDGVVSAVPGTSTTYTIVASNAGPDAVTGATVTDSFPAGCASVTWTCVGAGGGTCAASGSGNLNELVDLPVGGSVTYTAICAISPAASGTLSNTATVASATTDPVPGNNSATDTTDLLSPADVTGTKTASGSFSPGGAVTYTVVLTNASASPQLDNPGDEFTDTLPAGVTYVNATASSGTAAFAGGVVSWNGSIPASGSVTITIEVTIDAGTTGQTITNQGTVFYDADGDGTNESQRATDDPGLPGGADPTSFTVGGSVLEIPTLSGLGLAALALALTALALALLRRRQAA